MAEEMKKLEVANKDEKPEADDGREHVNLVFIGHVGKFKRFVCGVCSNIPKDAGKSTISGQIM